MINPLLTTKLFIPPIKGNVVLRRRLITRMNQGVKGKLVLVTAPAGFGKTTLLVEWANQAAMPVAWVSLDRADNDLIVFLSYIIAGIRATLPQINESLLITLNSPDPIPTHSVLASLINQLAGIQSPLALVIDDLHRIEDPRVIDALCFLIDHLPSNLHLLIASRCSSPFSCAKLRASGELLELYAKDLRFTSTETQEYLNAALGKRITKEEAAALESRTEGWITGMQLAVLAVNTDRNIRENAAEVSGTDRFITDYLIDEVLQHQPAEIQDFLLKTSILNRLCPSLSNAVAGIQNSEEMLEELYERGLFISPLDNSRTWYRYHHLFAEFLSHKIERSISNPVEELHQRAATWYEDAGLPSEAVKHAFVSKDFKTVLRIITRYADETWTSGRIATLAYWLDNVPETLITKEPEICLLMAWVKFLKGEVTEIKPLVAQAETNIQEIPDVKARNRLLGIRDAILAAYASRRSYKRDLLTEALELSQSALRLLPEDEYFWRISVSVTLGQAYLLSADLPKATEILTYAVETSKKIHYPLASTASLGILSRVYLAQGQVRRAIQICEQAVREVQLSVERQITPSSYVLLPLCEARFQQNDLAEARRIALQVLDESQLEGNIRAFVEGLLLLAKIDISEKNYEQGNEHLARAETRIVENNLSHLKTLCDAFRALVSNRIGESHLAQTWLQAASTDLAGNIVFYREAEYFILVELLAYNGRIRQALSLLDRIVQDAQGKGFANIQTRALIHQSYLLQQLGAESQALHVLTNAIPMAASQGLIRKFMDLGSSMVGLLEQAAAYDDAHREYLQNLLQQYPAAKRKTGTAQTLTQREYEVLHMIAQGCSNQEVSQKLHISVNTVKNHIKSIFNKFDSSSRTQAVARARELYLL